LSPRRRGGLLSLRLAEWLGAGASWGLLVALGAGIALGGSWLFTEYRLREGENALSELLDARRYRFLSSAALIAAAPKWASRQGLATRPEWVRARIARGGGAPLVAAPERTSELEKALADVGAPVGRRSADASLTLAVRVIVEVRAFPFVRHRRLEATFGTEREGEFQLTPPGAPWDDLPDPEAVVALDAERPAGLPPLPAPTEPALAALDAWRAAEASLARAYGRPRLEPGASPTGAGPEPRLVAAADALAARRLAVAPYLEEPGRDVLVGWLGGDGAEALEAALSGMAHLDVLLRAAATEKALATPLLGPYAARAAALREAVGESLARVGVLVP
jgi:hypothetical protein